jgi:hypothetical protein
MKTFTVVGGKWPSPGAAAQLRTLPCARFAGREGFFTYHEPPTTYHVVARPEVEA